MLANDLQRLDLISGGGWLIDFFASVISVVITPGKHTQVNIATSYTSLPRSQSVI